MARPAKRWAPERRNLDYEYQEQCALREWCGRQFFDLVDINGRVIKQNLGDLFEASLNGAWLQGDKKQRMIIWQKMKKAGARTSVSDVTIFARHKGQPGIKIEMKKQRKHFSGPAAIRNAVADGQAEYLQQMARQGWATVIAYGWLEAALFICNYFGWDPRAKGLC